jgi:hypothetical protein
MTNEYDKLPHQFRVWFDDGSATLTNGTDEQEARQIVQAGIDSGRYQGKIASVEQLD